MTPPLPGLMEAMRSKVSPNPEIACAMPCRASLLTQAPLAMEGGYSPMTARIIYEGAGAIPACGRP